MRLPPEEVKAIAALDKAQRQESAADLLRENRKRTKAAVEARTIAAVVAMLRAAPLRGPAETVYADAIERGDWRSYLPQDPTR